MIMVRLLMSVGSWLVCRLAEKATRPEPERTDMPRALPAGSDEGVESHTTKHLPSRMMGSVSFWPLDPKGPHNTSTPRRSRMSEWTDLRCMTEPGIFSQISLIAVDECHSGQIAESINMLHLKKHSEFAGSEEKERENLFLTVSSRRS